MSLGHRNDKALASVGPCWILSFDRCFLSRSFVAKDWTAAVAFLIQVSEIFEKNTVDNGPRNVSFPELHFTDGSTVKIVLPVARGVALSQAIDLAPFECSPTWLSAQPTLRDVTSSDLDETASFDANHYKNGPNGDFIQPGAIAKFGGTQSSSSCCGAGKTAVGILEDPETRGIARAKESLVKSLLLEPGDVVADIGAGTGLLVPLLSEAVGSTGQVIVSEISVVFREYLQQRFSILSNIKILDNPTDRDPKLPPGETVNVALMVDVYHHLEYPKWVLRHIRDSLKRHTGALVVIDSHREPSQVSPHDANRVHQHAETGHRHAGTVRQHAAGSSTHQHDAETGHRHVGSFHQHADSSAHQHAEIGHQHAGSVHQHEETGGHRHAGSVHQHAADGSAPHQHADRGHRHAECVHREHKDHDRAHQPHLRADKATYIQEIESAGFILVEEVDIPGLPENYCLVFRKRPLLMSKPGDVWAC